jgi:hypothetical protein
MKQELKALASHISSLKLQRKPLRGVVPGLAAAQYEYRHKHIASCLLRGTPYEAIESKVAEGNEPNWRYIDELKTLHTCTAETI